ncbi:MAG: zinc-ribbon domain-containing protein [Candidatus Ranarchaeia archaeon]
MSENYCPYCGASNPPGAAFCEKCGAPIQVAQVPQPSPQQPQPAYSPPPAYSPAVPPIPTAPVGQLTQAQIEAIEHKRKSGALAFILSLIIPGLGQVYSGKLARGILFFFGVIFLGVILITSGIGVLAIPIVLLLTAIDAYKQVQKHNRDLYHIAGVYPSPPTATNKTDI